MQTPNVTAINTQKYNLVLQGISLANFKIHQTFSKL